MVTGHDFPIATSQSMQFLYTIFAVAVAVGGTLGAPAPEETGAVEARACIGLPSVCFPGSTHTP